MSYTITQEDIDLTIQPCKVEMKLEIYDSGKKLVNILRGLVTNGSMSLNADSRVRRTFSPTIVPTDEQSIKIAENSDLWIDKAFKLFIGLTRLTGGETKWYPQGVYVLTGANNSYDSVTNQLQITLSDKMVQLDGTVNGEVFGALDLEIPAYIEIYRSSWTEKYGSFDEAYETHHSNDEVLMDSTVKALVKTLIDQYSTFSETDRYNCLDNLQKACDSINHCYKVDFGNVEEGSEDILLIGHNIIKSSIRALLNSYTDVTEFVIEDIGNYNGMVYSEDYESYRKENKYWDCIPYTQNFSCGSNVCAALEAFCTLYPNYDFSFDENGILVIRMIPTLEEDEVVLTYKQLKQILVADDTENSTVDLTTIRNICEVWGQSFESDYYSEECATSDKVYNVTIDNYGTTAYDDGDMISVKFDTTSASGMQLNINGIETVNIYKEYSDELIDEGAIQANNTYTLKFKKIYKDGVTTNKFYLLGQYQVHGLCVLTGNENDSLYTKEYFQKKYNCNNVLFEVIPDSPYTIQKIGERAKSYSGDTYESISSDTGAVEQANYELWKNCRLTDSVTIKTVLFPCISEYQKISYMKANSDTIKQYITHNVTHNFDDNTTTIEMYTFYPTKQK